MKQSDRPCPICNGPDFDILYHSNFELFEGDPLSPDYDVVCCGHCGFAYAATALQQDDYDRFYIEMSKYIDSVNSTGAGVSTTDRVRLETMAGDILQVVPKDARILDVGCANGGLLRILQEQGATHVVGVDPSPICAENAARNAGCPTYAATLKNMGSIGMGKFDCVVLSHVLEHVRDLRPCLESLKSVLDPDAVFYVETPDATRYRNYLFAPFQDFNTEHINHFSVSSMENLLRVSGWKPMKSGIKEIFSAPGRPYPALYVVARLDNGRDTAHATDDLIHMDETLRGSLAEYIEKSTALWRKVDAQLKAVLAEHGEVILWGAGQLAMKLLSGTCLRNARIAAIVDSSSSRHGKLIRGVKVIAPAQLDSGRAPIVITSMLHEEGIEKNIRKLGLKNPVVRLSM
jgi:2-polyprenyl-3-methyl-5-hydroxy-6-metoxy-1,4-benzoquinol methylase